MEMEEDVRERYAVFGIKPRNGNRAMCIVVGYWDGREMVDIARREAQIFLRADQYELTGEELTADTIEKAIEAFEEGARERCSGKLSFSSNTLNPDLLPDRRTICYVRASQA